MAVQSPVRELQRRAYVHTMEDGVTEIFAGVMFLISAGILASPRLISFMALLILVIPVAVNRIKNRVTYPRTGYVELIDQPPKQIVWGMFVFMAAAVVAMAVLLWGTGQVDDPTAWCRWAPMLAGILVGGGIHHAATRSGLWRIHVLQAISLTSAFAISLVGTGQSYAGVQVYCLLMAAVTFIAGVANFVRFLRRYPASAAKEPHHVEQ